MSVLALGVWLVVVSVGQCCRHGPGSRRAARSKLLDGPRCVPVALGPPSLLIRQQRRPIRDLAYPAGRSGREPLGRPMRAWLGVDGAPWPSLDASPARPGVLTASRVQSRPHAGHGPMRHSDAA